MKAVIFLGPTLPVSDARKVLDAVYLPPVEQAGLVSAVMTYRPDVVGIIDGMFLQSLSVWHKEILFAIEQGVRVYGSSSMGALRAAETAEFGMIGVGEVYRMYADGEVNDDDEVAVIHGPADTGYCKISEPMVNVRATLHRARDEGIIDDDLSRRLITIAKRIYFPDLTFLSLFERATAENVPDSVLDRLAKFVELNYRDIKREDAILLLETIRDLPDSLPKPIANFKLAPSIFHQTLCERDRTVRRDEVDVSLAAIGNYAAIHMPDFAELNFDALNRALVRVLAELFRLQVPAKAIDEEGFRFRYRYDLRADDDFGEWLKRNDLSREEFGTLMSEVAKCRALHRWLIMRNSTNRTTKFVLDQMRWRNRYEKWADAAAMQEQIVQLHRREFDQPDQDQNGLRDLVEDHLSHSGSFDGLHFSVWAEEAGFHKPNDLLAELSRSKVARDYLEKLAAQLAEVVADKGIAEPDGLAGEAG